MGGPQFLRSELTASHQFHLRFHLIGINRFEEWMDRTDAWMKSLNCPKLVSECREKSFVYAILAEAETVSV